MRKTLARYSPLWVIAVTLVTAACALLAAFGLVALINLHDQDRQLARIVAVLILGLGACWGAPTCFRALRQLFFARGAAIWLQDGKLFWDGGAASMPLDTVKSAQPAAGRMGWNDIAIETLDGRRRRIGALLTAEPRAEILDRISRERHGAG